MITPVNTTLTTLAAAVAAPRPAAPVQQGLDAVRQQPLASFQVELSSAGRTASALLALQDAGRQLQDARTAGDLAAVNAALDRFISAFAQANDTVDSLSAIGRNDREQQAFTVGSRVSEALLGLGDLSGGLGLPADSIGLVFGPGGVLDVDRAALESAFGQDPLGVLATLSSLGSQVDSVAAARLDNTAPSTGAGGIQAVGASAADLAAARHALEARNDALDPRLGQGIAAPGRARDAVSAFLGVASL